MANAQHHYYDQSLAPPVQYHHWIDTAHDTALRTRLRLQKPWLKIDLGSGNYIVSGVATQARHKQSARESES